MGGIGLELERIAISPSVLKEEIARITMEGHALARHGGAVTDEQLSYRAVTGIAPDGSFVVRDGQVVVPRSSTAFNTDELLVQSDLLVREQYLERAIALSKPGTARVTIEGANMGSVVGRGYDRVSATPGTPGPLRYFDDLTRATAVYEYDAAGSAWRTVTIYPVK